MYQIKKRKKKERIKFWKKDVSLVTKFIYV